MNGSKEGDGLQRGEGGVVRRGELDSGEGEMEPAREKGEVTIVGEMI
jgi:hypothetical protein